jgi:hypothetical protein
MNPSVGNGSVPYSFVATFRFSDVGITPNRSSFRRILDPSNGTDDPGFTSARDGRLLREHDRGPQPHRQLRRRGLRNVAITSLPLSASGSTAALTKKR